MSTIPASLYVQIVPGVVGAGGSALDLVGIALDNSTRVPIGQVLSFPTLAAVQTYFGSGSAQANAAAVYFRGFDNSNKKPGAMLFVQYPVSAVSGYLRGGNISGLTLTQLQAIASGTLTLSISGTPITSGTINLSAATSFSNAASIIEAAFTDPGFAVTYDSVSGAFVFTVTATGSTSTITYPTTDALATALLLTQATGAVLSQGAAAATPGTFMDGIVAITQDWVSFFTLFDPDNSGNANKLLFAEWTNEQNNRYAYIAWDTDITPTESMPASSSLGYLLQQNDYSGTNLNYEPSNQNVAAFVSGSIASIDFEETNGRTSFAYRTQSGLAAGVTTATAAVNLGGNPQSIGDFGNGYNYYGAIATANQNFLSYQRGTVSGPYLWLDSYINQIWLNNALQLSIFEGLTQVKSAPYNSAGYGLVDAWCMDPINAALNFGAIRAGVPLSESQAADVNNAAGTKIDNILSTRGWYLQILPATVQVRAARSSPPCTLWYMDGQSIQAISLASIEVE